MSECVVIPFSGTFSCWTQDFEFPDLLLAICESGQTGELHFKSSEAEKTLMLKQGAVVFAKSSSLDDRLDSYLLRRKKIGFNHVAELGRFVSSKKRFGTVLVEERVLSAHELVEAVIGQVHAIVKSLFTWTEAEYAFESKSLAKETIELDIPIARIVIEGVRAVTSWRRVSRGLGAFDQNFQRREAIEPLVQKAKLTPVESVTLSGLAQPQSIGEACASSQASDFEVCQLLWAFKALGWIQPVSERDEDSKTVPILDIEKDPDGIDLVLGAESA